MSLNITTFYSCTPCTSFLASETSIPNLVIKCRCSVFSCEVWLKIFWHSLSVSPRRLSHGGKRNYRYFYRAESTDFQDADDLIIKPSVLIIIHIIIMNITTSLDTTCLLITWVLKGKSANIDSGRVWEAVNCLLTNRFWSEEADFLMQHERMGRSKYDATWNSSSLFCENRYDTRGYLNLS